MSLQAQPRGSFPRPGDLLTARSELLHLGRRTASVRVEVTNQEEKLVVHGTVELLVLEASD